MCINRIFFLLILMLISSCDQISEQGLPNVAEEISSLDSKTEKEAYLESIYENDQNIRDGRSAELLLKYGENSSELQNFLFQMDSIDRLNLKRIDLFLERFGYPGKESFSNEANMAPWIVVHHATEVQARKNFFPIFQKAYLKGNLSANHFEGYLGRTYYLEFGEYPVMEGAYQMDEKINKMISDLNLGF